VSSGIGRALALTLCASGYELVLAARRRQLLEELCSKCGDQGAKAVAVPCDITQAEECQQLMDTARALGPDAEPVLVNSAGVAEFGDFATAPAASLESQIRTNLVGPLYACRAFLPWALENGRGQIVNVLSVAADLVLPGAAAYSSSKAGLLMLGRVLNAEYRKQGLRVTSILPGATDTTLWEAQNFVPPREDMLSAEAVAEAIRDLIMLPPDRNVDELKLMPPKGVL
jgi:short-subunit dehydrogenase